MTDILPYATIAETIIGIMYDMSIKVSLNTYYYYYGYYYYPTPVLGGLMRI